MLPVEQKGCKKKSRGIKDKLLIDRTILHDCRKRHTNLGMAWIDYKKAYDMAPHSRILESLDLVRLTTSRICEKINGKLANRADLMRRKFGES